MTRSVVTGSNELNDIARLFKQLGTTRTLVTIQKSHVSKVSMTDTDNQDRQWGLAALADGLNSVIHISDGSVSEN